MVSIFSSTSLILLRKIRYYNDFENSINILKEENNKLKKIMKNYKKISIHY